MLPARVLTVVGLLSLAAACDSQAPAGPSGATPITATTLAITGPDAVLTNVSTAYDATATFSDGRTQTGTTVWASSNPGIASVDAIGHVEGLTHGSTTLTATYVGRSASKTVRVVNNYGGSWVGKYEVDVCDGLPGWCDDAGWAAFSISLEVSQSGTDQSQIRAKFRLPNVLSAERWVSIEGSVTPDGRLKLAGSSELTDRSGRIWATFQVSGWDTDLSGPDAMTGRWEYRLSSVPTYRPPYNGYHQSELTMTRTSTGAPTTSAVH